MKEWVVDYSVILPSDVIQEESLIIQAASINEAIYRVDLRLALLEKNMIVKDSAIWSACLVDETGDPEEVF